MDAEAMRPLQRVGLLASLVLAMLAASTPCLAQGVQTPAPGAAAPDTREIIDALRPTRLRNLVVRPTAPEAAASVAVAAPVVALPVITPEPDNAPPAPAAPTGSTSASPSATPSLSLAIQFELNSSRVRPESGPVLGNLVAAMQSPDLKTSRFVIEGHTDARGVPTANLRLSQERAEEVRLYLVALGVHPARLKAVGKGASEPINPRDPLSADNRRVRVVTLE